MKAMKAMKAMKRVSKIAKGKLAKSLVLRGKKEKTVGGLTSGMLFKNKRGKVVSKKQSAKGKKLYEKYAAKWIKAVMSARKELKLQGFVPVKKGTALYAKAKAMYKR